MDAAALPPTSSTAPVTPTPATAPPPTTAPPPPVTPTPSTTAADDSTPTAASAADQDTSFPAAVASPGWKVRVDAYNGVADRLTRMQAWPDEPPDEEELALVAQVGEQLPTMLLDSNGAALGATLRVLDLFAAVAPAECQFALDDVVDAVVERAMGSKPAVQQAGVHAVVKLALRGAAGDGHGATVVRGLVRKTTHKNFKIVEGCVRALDTIARDSGGGVCISEALESLCPAVRTLLTNAKAPVRNATFDLIRSMLAVETAKAAGEERRDVVGCLDVEKLAPQMRKQVEKLVAQEEEAAARAAAEEVEEVEQEEVLPEAPAAVEDEERGEGRVGGTCARWAAENTPAKG